MSKALKLEELCALIKGKVLENSMITAKGAAAELSEICKAESVQVIGSKFVLYKESATLPKEKKIQLVK